MTLLDLVDAMSKTDKAKPVEISVVANCGEYATIKRRETGNLLEFVHHCVFPYYSRHEVVGYLNTDACTNITIKKP